MNPHIKTCAVLAALAAFCAAFLAFPAFALSVIALLFVAAVGIGAWAVYVVAYGLVNNNPCPEVSP